MILNAKKIFTKINIKGLKITKKSNVRSMYESS